MAGNALQAAGRPQQMAHRGLRSPFALAGAGLKPVVFRSEFWGHA